MLVRFVNGCFVAWEIDVDVRKKNGGEKGRKEWTGLRFTLIYQSLEERTLQKSDANGDAYFSCVRQVFLAALTLHSQFVMHV